MNNRHRNFISAFAAASAVVFCAPAAQAAEAWLRAESYAKVVPTDSSGSATRAVTMWGYSRCNAPASAGGPFENCGSASSPGPEITVPAGDSSLTIHLENALPESTSIMIAGQTKPMAPQSFTDGLGRSRIRAFDVEAAAGGGQQDYTWTNLRPGAYLYQSASHVQLQVQMGLYGALVHDTDIAAAPASPVAVTNASFELPDCSAGAPCTVDAVRGNWTTSATGWAISGSAGVFRPIASGPPGIAATDGAQVGWSNGGSLSQAVGAIAAGSVYTLTVDVGDRADSGFPGYTISLYAGGTGGTLLARDASSLAPVTGWLTSTVSYVSGATPPAGDLTIVLQSAGGQTEFDNVRLTVGPAGPCSGATCAYDGVPYDQSKVVVFSEIDPALHDPPTAANLTVDGYRPSFFLVNGQAFVSSRALGIANPGFESPDCGTSSCTIDAVRGNYTTSATGWTVSGAGGVFDPNPGIITPTEGDQVGWSSGGSLRQVLGETLVANTTYTLSVDVGDRSDTSFPGYSVALYAGGTLLAQDSGSLAPVSGFLTSTITYTSDGAPPSGNLEIRLTSGGSQIEFDNARLFASGSASGPVAVGGSDLVTAAPGERILLRLLNAGLQNRAPQLLGGYFEVVAEDGHPAPVRRLQYNTLLPAGKALDVLFAPDSAGTYPLYDRRLGLVNGLSTNGGQLGRIVVGAP